MSLPTMRNKRHFTQNQTWRGCIVTSTRALPCFAVATKYTIATPPRTIIGLFTDLLQFHTSPGAATSGLRLLPTSSAIRALRPPAPLAAVPLLPAASMSRTPGVRGGRLSDPQQLQPPPGTTTGSFQFPSLISAVHTLAPLAQHHPASTSLHAPPLRALLTVPPQSLTPAVHPPVAFQDRVRPPELLILRFHDVHLQVPTLKAVDHSAGVPRPTPAQPAMSLPVTPSSGSHTSMAPTTTSS